MLTIEEIRAVVADYFKDKPVKKVWLFGSYARGEADDESDVDILVELDYSRRIGFAFYGWPDELQEIFGIKTDVVSLGGLSKYIGPYILADRQLIYEETDSRQRAA